jgi:hypothetical protein
MIIHKDCGQFLTSVTTYQSQPLEEWVLYDGQWVVTEADPQEVDVTIEYYCGECGGILDEKETNAFRLATPAQQ